MALVAFGLACQATRACAEVEQMHGGRGPNPDKPIQIRENRPFAIYARLARLLHPRPSEQSAHEAQIVVDTNRPLAVYLLHGQRGDKGPMGRGGLDNGREESSRG